MKSWVFAAFLISVCALAACEDGDTGPVNSSVSGSGSGSGSGGSTGGNGGNGGNGGDGGSDGGGGAGEGGAGAATSTSSGPPTCAESSDTCGSDTNSGCYRCAADGPCKAVIDACVADEADKGCFVLMACLYECSKDADPATCEEACRTNFPDGEEAYDAIIGCTICEECAESCGASDEPLCEEQP